MILKKTIGLLISSVVSIGLLAACSQETEKVSVKEEGTKQKEEKQTPKPVAKKESPLGTRSNPIPFQKTATIEDDIYDDNGDSYPIKFDLTMEEIIRGEQAYQMLKKMNEFNEAPPEGYEYMIVKSKVKFVESETKDLAFNIDGIVNFAVVSESGDIYSGDITPSTEPEFSFEMYVGNEKEGYIAGLVKKDEKAQLRYQKNLDGEVFFNLQ
ncbi:hypothetical protein [Priestia koreensis]|uniref:hypothetical protein n=1 Tax=Priestia koreensis TaxID=284581 RepID=UPI0034592CAC